MFDFTVEKRYNCIRIQPEVRYEKSIILLFATAFALFLTACGDENMSNSEQEFQEEITQSSTDMEIIDTANPEEEDEPMQEKSLKMSIGDTTVEVEWEKNESVEALAELAETEPLVIEMSMYGGFEQVGSLDESLPRNDVQTTTEAGDIVLYSGNQIVVFYGSNLWAYTRLGHITDKTAEEMAELLSGGDVTITISMGE